MAFPGHALAALFLILLIAPSSAGRPSYYPCPGPKTRMSENVTCTTVAIPPGLCSSCPLRTPLPDGMFQDCANIYDTRAPTCLPAVRAYVAANPCDGMRANALATLEATPWDWRSRTDIDYFLYSMCEQCCDCVPMGANSANYGGYQALGRLTDPARGNCPAHAWYDVCEVLPAITHFTQIGQTASPELLKAPPACPMLRDWAQSPEYNNWATNPKTNIEPKLSDFLTNLLDVFQCAAPSIWNQCYDLESKQKNLGVPEPPLVLPSVGTSATPGSTAPATSDSIVSPIVSVAAASQVASSPLPVAGSVSATATLMAATPSVSIAATTDASRSAPTVSSSIATASVAASVKAALSSAAMTATPAMSASPAPSVSGAPVMPAVPSTSSTVPNASGQGISTAPSDSPMAVTASAQAQSLTGSVSASPATTDALLAASGTAVESVIPAASDVPVKSDIVPILPAVTVAPVASGTVAVSSTVAMASGTPVESVVPLESGASAVSAVPSVSGTPVESDILSALSGTPSVSGAPTVSGTPVESDIISALSGAAAVSGAPTMSGAPTVSGVATVSGAAVVSGTPAVSGVATVSGAPVVSGAATVSAVPEQSVNTTAANEKQANGTTPNADQASTGQTPEGGSTRSNVNGNSSRACFPTYATTTLRSGATVSMANLRIGDEVLVDNGRFSRVFLFTHRDDSVQSEHVRLELANGALLTLSPGHYLHANGALVSASHLSIGDALKTADGTLSHVVAVELVSAKGLYNPHTAAGTIVVDGVVCSTYTEAVQAGAAHALLAPLRALFRAGAISERNAGGLFAHAGASVL